MPRRNPLTRTVLKSEQLTGDLLASDACADADAPTCSEAAPAERSLVERMVRRVSSASGLGWEIQGEPMRHLEL